MVCERCLASVRKIFDDMGIEVSDVVLGEVSLSEPLTEQQKKILEKHLSENGFELLEEVSEKQIEKIKNLIVGKISALDIEENFKLSEYISQHIHKEYSGLSKLFSQFENTTLEQYFILQKIEKVKELLAYNEHTLSEISVMLGYKTVQHLSSQFRKTTGFSPSEFRRLKNKNRLPLDKIKS